MAKTKKKHSGKPRGMNYADMLARKRMIREAVQEAADDATVQLRADMATQKALWLAVCSVADAYGFGPERMKKFMLHFRKIMTRSRAWRKKLIPIMPTRSCGSRPSV